MKATSYGGTGRADITPTGEFRLESYARDENSQGVLDPLYLTVLVLSPVLGEPIAMLAIDNTALLVEEAHRLRTAVAEKAGTSVARTMLQVSHTHSAPKVTEEYLSFLESCATAATDEAMRDLRPCKLGWGTGRVQFGCNRRTLEGRAKPEMRVSPRPPVDDRLGVLLVEDDQSTPMAVLLWHGVHPNVLTGDSNVVSADWPGAARCVVESNLGCPMLFAVGAAGNVDPIWRGGVDDLRRIGLSVGEEALRVAGQIETRPIVHGEVASRLLEMHFTPLPEETEAIRHAQEISERFGVDSSPWLSAVKFYINSRKELPSLLLEVQCARLNDGVIGGIPMEVFSEIGVAVASNLSTSQVFFGGCTNGWIGYLPTPEEYISGGFELEMLPVKYGWITGWLTPPAPDTAAHVISATRELISNMLAAP